MRAIVLVGGEGTRLRPLTWHTPKALVPVLNRPLLEHLLLHLKRHGVTHVTLAMTRRSPQIRDAFGDGSRLGLPVDYAYEDTPLGSGGAIASIAAGWTETFFVCNGDVVTDLDLSAMLKHHRSTGAVLSISLHEVEDPSPFGVVAISGDGLISRFVEKPKREEAPSRLINAGTWLFEPELVPMMDATVFNRVEDSLFPDLCAAGRPVQGFHRPAYWADVGSAAALLRVNLDLAAMATEGGGTLVAEDASVEPSATVDRSVVGTGSTIAGDAVVRRSLLWDGVTIEAGAVVEDSILATGVHVGADARLERAIVAHGARIAPGTHLEDEAVEPADSFTGTRTATP